MVKCNATIYGVNDEIECIFGDYFQLISSLKADVIFLGPPSDEISYISKDAYE